MKSGARAVAVAAVAALSAGSGAGWAADRSAAASAPVTIVGPLEPNGGVKISGTTTVNGTVGATQSGAWAFGQAGPWTVGQSGSWSVGQAGGWSVGLEGPASAALANIDAVVQTIREAARTLRPPRCATTATAT